METTKVLITEEDLNLKIREVAKKISEDYAGLDVTLICILKGSVMFTCELAKNITGCNVKFDFISASSYGDSSSSSGVVKIIKDLDDSIEGKHVIVVEDIIDSGNTLAYLLEMLSQRNPASIKLCTLLDKPDRRIKPVKVDYNCFEIEDLFVVGFGLDYAQRYRNFPYIAVLEISE